MSTLNPKTRIRNGPRKSYGALSVYVDEDAVGLVERVKALGLKHKIPVSRLVWLCVEACMDTLEADMPKLRSFKLNGKTVSV